MADEGGEDLPPRLCAILDALEDTGYEGRCTDPAVLETACEAGVASADFRTLCCDIAQSLGSVAGTSCCLAPAEDDAAGEAFAMDLLGFLRDYGLFPRRCNAVGAGLCVATARQPGNTAHAHGQAFRTGRY